MELSDEAIQLLRAGGLHIELEAVVLGAHTFKAAGKDVGKVTVVGTKGGPMGHSIQCEPYGIFELDAEFSVYRELASRLDEPKRIKFKADLKPINDQGAYAMTMRQWSGCFAVWKQNGADRGLHECIAGTAGYQSVSDARVQLATAISVQRWTTARCGWGRVREYLLFRVRGLNG
ncbi:MAG: hypothetical protein CMK86_11385 [Pseudomonadales bacterium]|nr:hypothetical protein [Pseudomonadales bacterium]